MQKLIVTHGSRFLSKIVRAFALSLARLSRTLNRVNLLTPDERKVVQRNAQFKNKHKSQRAFVIVNGPSLREQNITPLGKEITFVVSGFYKHEVISSQWQPTYYCILDKAFFNGSSITLEFFRKLSTLIKDSIFFIPLFRGFQANHRDKLLPEERTYYIATAGPPSVKNEMTGVEQSFAGVSAFALAQAVYMGCSPIYLLGFDHDYLANRGVDRHFYAGGTMPGAGSQAAVPLADRVPYDEEMRMNLWLWKNYRMIKKVAEKNGIQIFNATSGGYLDVFQRANYEDIKFDQ